jgi:hypothetical protein
VVFVRPAGRNPVKRGDPSRLEMTGEGDTSSGRIRGAGWKTVSIGSGLPTH